MKDRALAILSLFASTSTLLCCALPTLLVTLGFGAVVAGAVSSLPWLAPLSLHKEWVFLGAGLVIAANWIVVQRHKPQDAQACPVPRSGADSACQVARRFSQSVLWLSTIVYAVGFITAFIAYPVAERVGWL